MSLLQIKNVSLSFGGVVAIKDFSMALGAGELLGIIGPNGAGKTTLFNVLTGVYAPDAGSVALEGASLLGKAPHAINRSGLARTFQNIRLFPHLTVLENVLVGMIPHGFASEKEARAQASSLLALFGLEGKKADLAKNLAYGEQRKLEIVRAMATKPKILLLDEPAAGMNATEKKELMRLIRGLASDGKLAILLIEHDMHVVMSLCPRIIVLDYGVKLAEGTPEEIRANPKVIEAYLGEKEDGST